MAGTATTPRWRRALKFPPRTWLLLGLAVALIAGAKYIENSLERDVPANQRPIVIAAKRLLLGGCDTDGLGLSILPVNSSAARTFIVGSVTLSDLADVCAGQPYSVTLGSTSDSPLGKPMAGPELKFTEQAHEPDSGTATLAYHGPAIPVAAVGFATVKIGESAAEDQV